jgi:hypothetical protein
MADPPSLKLGSWINVESVNCVVSRLRARNCAFGDCEVVFNSAKPINIDIKWNGAAWEFVKTGDFGTYADKFDRLQPYIAILKSGNS